MVREEIGIRKKKDKKIEDEEMGFGRWGEIYMAGSCQTHRSISILKSKKVSNIFEGVAIHVNGLTKPPMNELKDLMAAHGGLFHAYQVSNTTHIIASNLANVKIKQSGSVPIVKPAWITDSIAMGRLLEYHRYLLYTNQSKTQPRIQFPIVDKLPNANPFILNNAEVETEKVDISEKKEDISVIRAPEQSSRLPVKTASDPKFLEEFYNNSRLHLISTLGAEYKQMIGEMRLKSNGQFPGKEKLLKLKKGQSINNLRFDTVIMHIDMDCFFVSVGLRNNPSFRGKPVAITHARKGHITNVKPEHEANRKQEFALYCERLPQGVTSRIDQIDTQSSMSEIASCSYEARKCGVKNGMFLGQAVKICPDLRTLPYDFEGYKEVSNMLYKTIASYTLDIEAVSCDEMYVDVSNILKETGLSVDEWATHIRKEIMEVTGCPSSTGFGANRLQARLATRKAKPAGQFHLKLDDVAMYMAEISLSDLPGVGRATLSKLIHLGLNTCGDVQMTSLKVLQSEFGQKAGETLLEQSKGIDRKPLNFHHERKSVSAEVNYGIRFRTLDECFNFLQSLSNEVYGRLNDINMRARCLTLKLLVRAPDAPVETAKYLGHGICDSLSKSTSNININNPRIIFEETKALYEKLNPPFVDLRGVGIQLSKLEKNIVKNTALRNFLTLPCDKGIDKSDKKIKIPIDVEILQISEKNEISKQVTKSKRGRPRKDRGNCENMEMKSTSKLLTGFFGKTKKMEVNQKSQKFVAAKYEIDLRVLNELPEELRREIMSEYELETSVLSTSKVVEPTRTGHMVIPQKHVTKAFTKTEQIHFVNLTWEQVKHVIKKWMESGDDPEQVDVDMIASYFKRLALNRQIESLKGMFSFLHRNFSELNCNWHKAYFKVVNFMQEGMVARYGVTLMVLRKFHCCKMDLHHKDSRLQL
ncbi:hypothetical protein JTB14_028543 [Gonioctena quinquepunctata]|nr:hypothetical protein JTB14_028543 [Gonioctena quinquepunctata]